jgi:ABC-2 type transport system ATP-binding protein
MHSLKINNLTKYYANGVKALSNISLEINNGMFGLLGPNGAGKSTLMRTIVGLQLPDAGEVLLNGINVIENPMFIKERLGFLPQDFGVYPKISAFNLLNHIAILKGVSNNKARKEQVHSLLEKVNLLAQKNNEVRTFSGGMRQRFGVAQALLGNPSIVIVDEPTAGLDPEERNRFNGLLSEIGSDRIVILSTHLVEDVRNLCNQMAIMHNGKILLQGNPNDFVSELKGKIWQKEIPKEELELYASSSNMIASYYLGGKMNVKLYSEENLPEFEVINPTLEEVYFKTINEMK